MIFILRDSCWWARDFIYVGLPVVSSRPRLSCLNLLTLARTQTHKPTHARTHLPADHTRLGAGAILQSTLNPLSRLSPREGRPCCVTREISFARDGYPLPIICPGYPQAALHQILYVFAAWVALRPDAVASTSNQHCIAHCLAPSARHYNTHGAGPLRFADNLHECRQ